MLISIIVPIFNVEQYLDKCIQSILQQSHKDIEIIAINDGSTDNSYEKIVSYAEKDSRIKVFNQENKGLIATRMKGVQLAKGKWIGFVDSDDWIEPCMYERLSFYAEKYQCDLVSSGIVRDYENEKISEEVYDIYPEKLYTQLSTEIYPSMLYDFDKSEMGLKCALVNKLFKRSLLEKVYSNIDSNVFFGEDVLAIYKYCLLCKSIYVLNEAYYHYYIHEGSMCRSADSKLAQNTYYLYQDLKTTFQNSKDKYALMKQLRQYIISLEIHTLKQLYDIDILSYAEWDFKKYKSLYNKKLVIYGAGACGQALYRDIVKEKKSENIVGWIDKQYISKTDECLYDIQPIEWITDKSFDCVIIAIKDKNIAAKIKKSLIEEYSVIADKILWSNVTYRKIFD